MATDTASATSMNFVGFENMKGTGTAEILYNRVYIMPALPVTAGRYIHAKDDWPAPLDPNFSGAGRVVTDEQGRYRYVTIRPGAYPWGNHKNAWRPAHIHLSLLGPAFSTRLVTQMYFPDDPLIEIDPIANAVPMPYRQRMVSRFDMATTVPNWALGYVFDIVLKGREQTPFEDDHDDDH